jgi:hypothetical protein
MKIPDNYTIFSLFISLLSLFVAIFTGFWGGKLASYVSVVIMLFTWGLWVTVKIISLEKRNGSILSGDESFCSNHHLPSLPPKDLIPYNPKFHFFEENPITIDNLKKKVKIPSEFLTWNKFTILFWVKITEEFLNSRNNRYLFSYTTDPNSKKDRPIYPNAFFLGILGGTLNWRFVVKGPDPSNEKVMRFSSHEGLKGWKLFSIRWETHTETIKLSIDGGRVYANKDILPKASRPIYSKKNFFHLGGWQDTWAGGLSLLDFYNFRVFDTHLTDGELLDLLEAEKPKNKLL